MQKRQITLADGRYMIFFTFPDDDADPRVPGLVKTESEQITETQSEDKQDV